MSGNFGNTGGGGSPYGSLRDELMSSMPKLPGLTGRDPRAAAKPRSQTLKVFKGEMIVADPDPVARNLKETMAATVALGGKGVPPPREGQVLRFYGYFKEAVHEMPRENHRVRRCVILYYLDDCSTQINECREDNSGIPQGTFMNRHVVLKATGEAMSPLDFITGKDVSLYGRTYHMTSMDYSTREFFLLRGVETPPDENVPSGPYKHDKGIRVATHTKSSEASQLKKFYENDRMVLRFYCVWDDTAAMDGIVHQLVLHYFLADDTVEVLERYERNSGLDPFPVLLKRAPLPVRATLSGLAGTTGRDSPFTGGKKVVKNVAPSDLSLGQSLQVYGRVLFLYDCDEFTRKYYIDKLGRNPAEMDPIPLPSEPAQPVRIPVPPHNGIGNEEDTLQNVKYLVPRPPKKDILRQLQLSRQYMTFQARMVDIHATLAREAGIAVVPVSPVDAERRFVIQYFLEDDTLQIFEPPQRNSGIVGGKFLARCKAPKKPAGRLGGNSNAGGDLGGSDPSSPSSANASRYQLFDFFVGARIVVNSRCFLLEEADEVTLKFMEAHPEAFPQSDRDLVLDKVRTAVADRGGDRVLDDLAGAFVELDRESTGALGPALLQRALAAIGLPSLSTQEAITLCNVVDPTRSLKATAAALRKALAS